MKLEIKSVNASDNIRKLLFYNIYVIRYKSIIVINKKLKVPQ
nr:MAG TPA: hypothetical protein [Caudoviricetes sp.]